MGLFAPPSQSSTRIFSIPESDVQIAGVASADILVNTFPANVKFMVTRFTAVIYTSQTTINPSVTTGPQLRCISTLATGGNDQNIFNSLTINGLVYAPGETDAVTGQGSNQIISGAASRSLFIRVVAASGRYTNFRCGFVVEGCFL